MSFVTKRHLFRVLDPHGTCARGGCYGKRRHPSSTAGRVAAVMLVFGSISALSAFACSGPQTTGPKPEATLASSREAQQQFRSLRARYFSKTGRQRQNLVTQLSYFIDRFPHDERARHASVYLAWLRIEAAELDAAERILSKALKGPTGSARDLALVAQAAILRQRARPQRALEQLRQLRGKIVDAQERFIFSRELVASAILAHSFSELVEYLHDLLVEAPGEEHERVRKLCTEALQSMPAAALEQSLATLDAASRQSSGFSQSQAFLRNAIRTELTRTALRTQNAELARRLLSSAPASIRGGPTGIELSRLASSGSVQARIFGRSIGLVLSLDTAQNRRRSAAVAAGVTRALGLVSPAPGAAGIRLFVRDDGGRSEGLARAMAELAGDGAAILIAGVDARGAERASRYAESAGIATMLLYPPSHAEQLRASFILGVDPEQVAKELLLELERRGARSIVRIGPGGLSCDTELEAAGQARFPAPQWKRDKIDALLLLGDAGCARAVLRDVERAGLPALLAFGLESAELYQELGTRWPKLSASIGRFPLNASGPSGKASLEQSVSYHELLGHDAGVLAAAALEDFPLDRVEDSRAVSERHERARRRLAGARADLWSATAAGFNKRQHIDRQIGMVFAVRGGKVP